MGEILLFPCMMSARAIIRSFKKESILQNQSKVKRKWFPFC